ncbi:MAG: hypothetical protein WC679_01550 [Bacteroidales bacterium]
MKHITNGTLQEYLTTVGYQILQGNPLTSEQIDNIDWYADKARQKIRDDLRIDLGLFIVGKNLDDIVERMFTNGWRKNI